MECIEIYNNAERRKTMKTVKDNKKLKMEEKREAQFEQMV